MNLQNIQIGIDLGTTNSEVAINNNGTPEIIKNNNQMEYTPSVFGFDKNNNKIVGKKAYEKYFKSPKPDDIENFKAEVKRQMGSSEKFRFPRANKSFSPEEISAEILKTLKEDILKKYPDFFTSAAVITTPASFDTTQAEATKRAGNLAGFSHVVLLQEPIAAAIAYRYLKNCDDENILVYDLGGGTFDVALISSKGGNLSVLSHNGDNFLGGKDIDALIVKEVIVPKISEKYFIRNFEETILNDKTRFNILKYFAEKAKIELSQDSTTIIEIEKIGKDDKGDEINLSIDFSRAQLEPLINPLIDTTIQLAQKTIQDAGVETTSINKIILVGGPTQIPHLRQRLQKELNIPLDTSMDPLTIVARGASIFAIGQQLPQELKEKNLPHTADAKSINLNFNSLTSENEEIITGVIPELKDSTKEYFIQIQSDSGHYSSQKIKLNKGKFFETVVLIPNRTNLFWIFVFDGDGKPIAVYPDSFSITQSISFSGAPIPHSIGVAVAKKDFNTGFSFKEVFEPIFEKGSILPLESEPKKYRTIISLKKGEENLLPIKVYEGESEIPDRNTFVCDVKIQGTELPYDLPENTEVELKLKVDVSRGVELEVYVPVIDRLMSARGSMFAESIDMAQFESEFKTELERAAKIEEDCSIDERLTLSRTVNTIDRGMTQARSDEDEKRKIHKQLKELKIILDKLEKDKEIPQLVKIFHGHTTQIERMIEEICQPQDKQRNIDQLNILKKEGEYAISKNDKFLLVRVNEQLHNLGSRIYFSQPGAWVQKFNEIVERNEQLRNQKDAQYYIEKGNRCISSGDIEGLRVCVLNLIKFLPPDEQTILNSAMSGITH